MKHEEYTQLDAKEYGLPPRTILEKRGGLICIIVRRKSRIIMADGKKLVEKAGRIRQAAPSATVGFVTTAPICSKTREYLTTSGIAIQEE